MRRGPIRSIPPSGKPQQRRTFGQLTARVGSSPSYQTKRTKKGAIHYTNFHEIVHITPEFRATKSVPGRPGKPITLHGEAVRKDDRAIVDRHLSKIGYTISASGRVHKIWKGRLTKGEVAYLRTHRVPEPIIEALLKKRKITAEEIRKVMELAHTGKGADPLHFFKLTEKDVARLQHHFKSWSSSY